MPEDQTHDTAAAEPTPSDAPALRPVYLDRDEIPEAYRPLYAERDGRYRLAIPGIKTDEEVRALDTALRRERQNVQTAAEKAREAEEQARQAREDLDRLRRRGHADEPDDDDQPRRRRGSNGRDDHDLERAWQKRYDEDLGKANRRLEEAEAQRKELADTVASFVARERQRTVDDAIRRVMRAEKVIAKDDDVLAIARQLFTLDEDGMVIARDEAGPIPNLTPEKWLNEQRIERPYWWHRIAGGGANGAGPEGAPRRKRSDMSVDEKAEYIAKYGQDKYLALPW